MRDGRLFVLLVSHYQQGPALTVAISSSERQTTSGRYYSSRSTRTLFFLIRPTEFKEQVDRLYHSWAITVRRRHQRRLSSLLCAIRRIQATLVLYTPSQNDQYGRVPFVSEFGASWDTCQQTKASTQTAGTVTSLRNEIHCSHCVNTLAPGKVSTPTRVGTLNEAKARVA